MEFEPGFRFDMDDAFGMCGQAMSCPSTTSFSSASSAYDPFTPTSRRSTPNELHLDFENPCSFNSANPVDLTPSSTTSMSKFMFGPVKTEAEPRPYPETLPTTPIRKMESASNDYDHLIDMNMHSQHSLGSITPSTSFGMYTISPQTAIGPSSFMMTHTQSQSGSEVTDYRSTWPCSNDSPISFFPPRNLPSQDLEHLEFDRHSTQSPFGGFPHHMSRPPSANRLSSQRRMMVQEVQRKTTDLQRAQIRASKKRAGKPDVSPVDVVRRAMCRCDYPGCRKAFRRNEHLKRHKQTFHGEGPNRFSCEFCGKDQFNRQDNLNNHRKLHARPNSRNRGVEYIPAAVAVIQQEERSRKRRAPSKAKMA